MFYAIATISLPLLLPGCGGGGGSGAPGAPANVQAVPGATQVRVSWNDVAQADSYTLYYATQPGIDPANAATYSGAIAGATSPQDVGALARGQKWYFAVTARAGTRESAPSAEATAFTSTVNDTGTDWCANNTTNYNTDGTAEERGQGCVAVMLSHFGQDGHVGRDAAARAGTLPKIGSGRAGFDFTKICRNGEAAGEGICPSDPQYNDDPNDVTGQPTDWACTRDNVTGLTWELKSAQLAHWGYYLHRYTWFSSPGLGGEPGNTTTCNNTLNGTACNTQNYVEWVRNLTGAARLCGATDWRLPTTEELLTIVDLGSIDPAIDTSAFPQIANFYWSATPLARAFTEPPLPDPWFGVMSFRPNPALQFDSTPDFATSVMLVR